MDNHLQLVVVVWDDAWQDQDNFATEHGVRATHTAMPVQTIGWLIVDDATGVSVANERSTDAGSEVYRGRTFVPRAMVRSVTPFKLTRPRKKKEVQHG